MLGGGTRALPNLAEPRPQVVIDLAFAGLDQVSRADPGIWLGAMLPLGASPGLMPQAWREAVADFTPRAVRRQATVGGNLRVRGSLWPVARLLDATVEIASVEGSRQVPIQDAHAKPGELWTRVLLPLQPDLSGYTSLRRTPVGPVLVAVALARVEGTWRAVVQAGGRLELKTCADPRGWPQQLARETDVVGDLRGAQVYRRAMVEVLAERLLRRLVT